MKMYDLLINKRASFFLLIVCCAFIFSGCQQPVTKEKVIEPVFFPKPPDKARLQFLKSFSGPEDIGVEGPSAWESFIVGETKNIETILKPYGLAVFQGKLYVCDVGKRKVAVLDIENHTFSYLTQDRRLMDPRNIYIESDGTKYVADPTVGALFVFDKNNNLSAILGRELNIRPEDVVVRGQHCYVADSNSNQVVVLDKTTGIEVNRFGQQGELEDAHASLSDLPAGYFLLISDLTTDRQGNIYVTDKAAARITEFDKSGVFKRTIGSWGLGIHQFIRPKGIAIDKEDRIWVVDTAPEVVKIYNPEGMLLLFFGLPGNKPGMMNMPAKVVVDYDHVELFQKYAVKGAKIEFLVFVTNQYGPRFVAVYGFGSFPEQQPAGIE
jgi:DNA-binding beta-propeller fold protein YncE